MRVFVLERVEVFGDRMLQGLLEHICEKEGEEKGRGVKKKVGGQKRMLGVKIECWGLKKTVVHIIFTIATTTATIIVTIMMMINIAITIIIIYYDCYDDCVL